MLRLLAAPALALALAAPALADRAPPVARDGAIDLGDWDFAREGIVDLAGDWQIAWGQFEDPSAALTGNPARRAIAVPSPWNSAGMPGKPPGGFGHATYRLSVACHSRARLALVLPIQHSAVSYYVNGRPVAAQGSPGASAELARPGFVQQIVPLEDSACPLRIVAHVSNFEMRNGGLLRSVELGTEHQVRERRELGLARDLFSLGGLSLLCLMPILFFFWRRQDRAPLWFGLYCLSSAGFVGLGGERILQPLVAPLGWEAAWKLVMLCLLGGLASFPAFVRSLYPAAFPRLAFPAILGSLALISLVVAATPARIYTQAVPLIYAVSIAVAAVTVAALARAALQGARARAQARRQLRPVRLSLGLGTQQDDRATRPRAGPGRARGRGGGAAGASRFGHGGIPDQPGWFVGTRGGERAHVT